MAKKPKDEYGPLGYDPMGWGPLKPKRPKHPSRAGSDNKPKPKPRVGGKAIGKKPYPPKDSPPRRQIPNRPIPKRPDGGRRTDPKPPSRITKPFKGPFKGGPSKIIKPYKGTKTRDKDILRMLLAKKKKKA
jgi:hypothetical protein